jgi:hypothetical protein
MPKVRTGARSALNLIRKACQLSTTPGFRTGVLTILGPGDGGDFLAAWDTFCLVFNPIVGNDDWFNQIDYLPEESGTEDIGVM